MPIMDAQRNKTILTLALPIIGGMVSQNILNLIDTAMVGHLGDQALAAVGLSGFLSFMSTAFITGLAAGVQAMSARRMGEGRLSEMAQPLNGGLLLAAILALPLTALLYQLVPYIFPLLVDDTAVHAIGIPYLQVRILGILAIGCNFVFRGYWNGVNLSKLYMRTLIVMHITNVILNYAFIYGELGAPKLGATGAAIGTTTSLFVGTLYYIALALKHAKDAGFAKHLPDKQTLLTMARLSIPNGIQNFFFAAGMTTFFVIVGKVGTAQLAASQVLVNLLLVALLPGIGFGLSAASLVGQALGRKQPEDAVRWGWDVAKLAMLVAFVLGIPAAIYPDMLLIPFIRDPDTLALARGPLRLIALTIWLDIGGTVLMNALLGAGDNRRVMGVSVLMQWGVNLPLCYLLGPVAGLGLMGIWGVQSVYRIIQGAIFATIWHRATWTKIKL